MHTVQEMSAQLSRNEALNLLEAAVATAVIAGGGMANSLDSTERLMYISCCLSNAYCLRCALALFCILVTQAFRCLGLALSRSRES